MIHFHASSSSSSSHNFQQLIGGDPDSVGKRPGVVLELGLRAHGIGTHGNEEPRPLLDDGCHSHAMHALEDDGSAVEAQTARDGLNDNKKTGPVSATTRLDG